MRLWLVRLSVVVLTMVGLQAPLSSITLAKSSVALDRQLTLQAAPIAFGVTHPDVPWDPTQIDALADLLGRMPAIIAWYQAWGASSSALDLALLEAVRSRGAVPLITWEPWGGSTSFPLTAIARGDFDAYIDTWAVGLAEYGAPVYLRFAHEMNGDWYPWSVGVNGNSVGDYVAAWRHVHDRFAAAGASNVSWIWAPIAGPSAGVVATYPGDAYVDWVGLDGFNYGTTKPDSSWTSFASIFASSYGAVQTLTDKSIMIAETGSTEEGGDKVAWVKDAFATQLPYQFPDVRAVIWFNRDKETDWRVDSSVASLAAFREVLANPYLQGTLLQSPAF